MKRLLIPMEYIALGESYIDVPDHFTMEEAIEYAREHYDELPCGKEVDVLLEHGAMDINNCKFTTIQERHC